MLRINFMRRLKMKKSNWHLIKYELKNNINNGYSFFFGAVFPLMLLVLLSKTVTSDLPENVKAPVITSLFLSMSMIVPLATMFLGYAATYANELEKDVPLRLNLFGISQNRLFSSKLIANYIFFTGCLAFFAISLFFIKIEPGKPVAILVWLLVIYIFSAFLLALAHGISSMIKSFGPTYGVAMGLYFIIMILSGMMGISLDNLPKFLQPVAKLLPPTQIGGNFVDFWMGKSYNFAPLIQSMLFFGAISFIILLISFRINKRKNK